MDTPRTSWAGLDAAVLRQCGIYVPHIDGVNPLMSMVVGGPEWLRLRRQLPRSMRRKVNDFRSRRANMSRKQCIREVSEIVREAQAMMMWWGPEGRL